MQIESVYQEDLTEFDATMTTVVLNQVDSQCILARLFIKAMGRPGIDNDLEFIGSGDRWTVMWTQPVLSIAETTAIVQQAIH
ncbi:MAG: hypothetical protein AAGF24_03055 [Cyanobacteria bacterium P01_H01_bin.121]